MRTPDRSRMRAVREIRRWPGHRVPVGERCQRAEVDRGSIRLRGPSAARLRPVRTVEDAMGPDRWATGLAASTVFGAAFREYHGIP